MADFYEQLKTVKVRDEKKFTSIPNKKHLQSDVEKSWRWVSARGVFLPNWTRRASMVTARN